MVSARWLRDNSESHDSHVTLTILQGHSHTGFKILPFPCSGFEPKKPLGWEVKHLEETESPAAYDTALSITMTWMVNVLDLNTYNSSKPHTYTHTHNSTSWPAMCHMIGQWRRGKEGPSLIRLRPIRQDGGGHCCLAPYCFSAPAGSSVSYTHTRTHAHTHTMNIKYTPLLMYLVLFWYFFLGG